MAAINLKGKYDNFQAQNTPSSSTIPEQDPAEPKKDSIEDSIIGMNKDISIIKKKGSPKKKNNPLEGFSAQRLLAVETMTTFNTQSELNEDQSILAKTEIPKVTDSKEEGTIDSGNSRKIITQNQQKSKDAADEESSVHARDTDDIMNFSQNDTNEAFDAIEYKGNITELCGAEKLSFDKELNLEALNYKKKAVNAQVKNKTDGFLVSNLEVEEDDALVAQVQKDSRPVVGGSHKFKLYSESNQGNIDDGDFDLNKISETDIDLEASRKTESYNDIQYSDESDSNDSGDRRRAQEVDFDF